MDVAVGAIDRRAGKTPAASAARHSSAATILKISAIARSLVLQHALEQLELFAQGAFGGARGPSILRTACSTVV